MIRPIIAALMTLGVVSAQAQQLSTDPFATPIEANRGADFCAHQSARS